MATAHTPPTSPNIKDNQDELAWKGMSGFGDEISQKVKSVRGGNIGEKPARGGGITIPYRTFFTNYWQRHFDGVMFSIFEIMSKPENRWFFAKIIKKNDLSDDQLHERCNRLVDSFVEQLISEEQNLDVFVVLRKKFPDRFADNNTFLYLTMGVSDDNVKISNPYNFIDILKYVVYSYVKFAKKIALTGKFTSILSFVSLSGRQTYEHAKDVHRTHRQAYKTGVSASEYLDNLLANSIGDVEFSKASPEVLERVSRELMRIYGYGVNDIERARQVVRDPERVLSIYKKISAEYAKEKRDERERLEKDQTKLQHLIGKALKGAPLGIGKAYDFLMRTPEENVSLWKKSQREKNANIADAYAKHVAGLDANDSVKPVKK
jgi:hypothetical protein